MFVKVCGITDTAEIDEAVKLGYDAIGIVLYPKSKRFVTPEKAASLARYAKNRILTVAVSIPFSDVALVANDFNFIQVYEPVDIENLIYASNIIPKKGMKFKYFLYDNSKGSGKLDDIPLWTKMLKDKLIIAGGLNSENVVEIVKKFKPFGVDVSSGVENIFGKKDFNKMAKFIKVVKSIVI
jgi:phosphoribosylanthranilate isomerase